MRSVARILVILVALAVLVVNPVIETSSTGTWAIVPIGALIDLVAIVAIGAALVTWRRAAAA
jgi:hypothetical protein